MAGSSALEFGYLMLLARGYSRAAMSFVYPIARGSAPVLVLAVSVLALGAAISVGAAFGVLLVAGGIVLVRGRRSSGQLRDLALALAIGMSIAGYTLVDKHGLRHAAPISYLELVLAATASAYLIGILRWRGTAAVRAALRPSAVLAGAGVFGSYVLVLAALRLASAASVAAVRESSVLMATAWLALRGREHVTPERLAGAVAVVAGIALISLG